MRAKEDVRQLKDGDSVTLIGEVEFIAQFINLEIRLLKLHKTTIQILGRVTRLTLAEAIFLTYHVIRKCMVKKGWLWKRTGSELWMLQML